MRLTQLKLQRQCRVRLGDLDIPDPWDVQEFCDRLARRRGRPLHLLPVPARPGTERLCGMWLPLPDADVIFVKWNTTVWHREQIILHECSHMICDHPPSMAGLAQWTRDDLAEWIRDYLPEGRWDTDVLAGVLMRSRYDLPVENEAEALAGLIEQRAPRRDADVATDGLTAAAPAEVVEVLDRFARALGAPRP